MLAMVMAISIYVAPDGTVESACRCQMGDRFGLTEHVLNQEDMPKLITSDGLYKWSYDGQKLVERDLSSERADKASKKSSREGAIARIKAVNKNTVQDPVLKDILEILKGDL